MSGTTAFPTALDTFPAIGPSTQEDAAGVEHDVVHENVHAAVAALQAKVGIDGSSDVDSIDYKLDAAATLAGAAVPSSALGTSVATLVGGTVPSAQLPSYVDDVIEVANYAALPGTGETGKIYIALDTNTQYRWSGSVYVELVASPGTTDAVPEGSTNLYFTAARVLAVVLTGLSLTTNAAITATDTVLSALGKLQKQLTDLLARTTGTNTGDQTNVTGNAGTATKLATARNINGVAFDGSAAVTITAVKQFDGLALSDRQTALTTTTSANDWLVPVNCTLNEIYPAVTVAQSSSGPVTIDAKRGGTSVFSTLPSIAASNSLPTTAGVLSTTSFNKGDIVVFSITAAGTGAKGLQTRIAYTPA